MFGGFSLHGHRWPWRDNFSSKFTFRGKSRILKFTLTELASVSLSLFNQSQDLAHVLRMREELQSDVENEGWGEGCVPM